MACIPYTQWLGANAGCKAKTSTFSVQGFGYTRTGIAGLRGLGLRGLGAGFDVSVTPASIATAIQGGGLVQSAPPPSTPPVISQPTLNTTPVYNDPNDPCYIASQTPCPAGTGCPAQCPSGYHSIDLLVAPGKPAQCACGKDKAASAPSAMTLVPGGSATAPPSGNPVLTPTPGGILQSNVATGGFSHWGLLAAVAVGGTALYLVMRKKAA